MKPKLPKMDSSTDISQFWSDSNPHVIREGKFQETWSFNVYCAIKNDSVVVVHIYDENLTGIFVSNLL